MVAVLDVAIAAEDVHPKHEDNISENSPVINEDIILVMGPTGAGKTSFINSVSNSNLKVGRGFKSCTEQMQFSQPVRFRLPKVALPVDGADQHQGNEVNAAVDRDDDGEEFQERTVRFLDSPGLEDTNLTDVELFALIVACLTPLYKRGNRLLGILYFVDFTSKMRGNTVCDIEMFRNLVGQDATKNVFIMIGKQDLVDKQSVEEGIVELRETFLKELCDSGAQIWRGSYEAVTLEILRHNRPAPLKIQQEIVDEKKMLIETAAGGVLDRQLDKKIQKNREIRGMMRRVDAAQLGLSDEQRRARLAEYERQNQGFEQAQAAMFRGEDDLMKIAAGLIAGCVIYGVKIAIEHGFSKV